jgi:hypothetical protein
MWRRNQEAAQRFAERRQREDDAVRLSATVPGLESLRLEMQESRSGISNPEASHIRRIVVSSAPALFVLPCHDTQCKEGGHDITADILSALRARKLRFEGEDPCSGVVGSANCQRILRYVGVATYTDAAQRPPSSALETATERPRPAR